MMTNGENNDKFEQFMGKFILGAMILCGIALVALAVILVVALLITQTGAFLFILGLFVLAFIIGHFAYKHL